jgi:hypothetical protein
MSKHPERAQVYFLHMPDAEGCIFEVTIESKLTLTFCESRLTVVAILDY